MDITFTTEQTLRRTDEIIDYLRGPRLGISRADYPDFEAWLDRAHVQLKAESKRALIALSSGNVIGVVLYQKHLTQTAIEVKNITVRPDQRGRYVASFLLRNVEFEGKSDYACHQVLLDTKVGNQAIQSLLTKSGYQPIEITDLYGLCSGLDVVYGKVLP